MVSRNFYDNLWDCIFDLRPPFQIDGNFGYTAGVAEMLLQSHAGEIHLLPAVPEPWPSGSLKGLRARGGVVVDFAWNDGKVRDVALAATRDAEVRVRMNGAVTELDLAAGETKRLR